MGIMKAHVVAVPFPALAHMIPLLEFAKELAAHSITVSFVTTPANEHRLHQQITHVISSGLDIRLLVLPTPQIQGLPEGLESFEQIPRELCPKFFQLAQKLEQPFDSWIEAQKAQDKRPLCIIYDALLGWSMEAAHKHRIPAIAFSKYGTFGLSVMHSAWLSDAQNRVEKQGNDLVLSLDLPAPLKFQGHEIDEGLWVPFMMEVLGRLESAKKGCGILVNTFEELEGDFVQHMRNLTGKPVWCIGPLLPPNFCSRGKMADTGVKDLVQWLDSHKPRSVLYVSFGSQTFLSEEQSKALASGLEASEQAFIWAFKVPPGVKPATCPDLAATYLPQGFMERTKCRGLVIWGWVPQLVILSHSSVGALMSHCGWNSMLESVSLGIPMVTWPMYADQHFNSRLAVGLGMGIQVCQHSAGIPDEQRVKEGVRLVLCKDEGKEMMKSAQRLKEMAAGAVAVGGSSDANFQDFLREIHMLDMTRKTVSF
ncbi:hypothetical protein SUGI_0758650 [Cryptomeria japonica]|uniref:scopoletin glucosyltransferase n=1 Tax=Cryptomeria japonica TaxID=3369 RepID=UPI00241470BD|nr:scopoletin glucosyltransferase [Cryptomeria japonica]GLJ37382.1 hypothetical protein SUGI_0758650 [Cryptomeria japonica]